MKATELYFPVVLFIIVCKVVLSIILRKGKKLTLHDDKCQSKQISKKNIPVSCIALWKVSKGMFNKK